MDWGFLPSNRASMPMTTRTSFLEQIQSGNENAWREFYTRYAGMINHIGQQRNLTADECDDLMVDVMVIFWKKVAAFIYDPERGRFRNYLSKITDYAAMKIFRRNRNEDLVLSGSGDDIEYPNDVDSVYMAEWQAFILERALEDLKNSVDTDSYQVFYMSVVQKRPVKEVSAITRKTSNNIYVIRSRCLKKLKELIAGYRQCEESELMRHSTRKS